MASSAFQETILGEATETAVKATGAKLVAGKGRLTTPSQRAQNSGWRGSFR